MCVVVCGFLLFVYMCGVVLMVLNVLCVVCVVYVDVDDVCVCECE